MNLIEMELKNKIYDACTNAFEIELDKDLVMVEMPRDPSLGDYSTNIAMRLTKILRQNPRLIAEKIVAYLNEHLTIANSIEIANPGFINFRLRKSCMADIINVVLDKDEHYGENDSGKGEKILVEYVSANPTGNLHLGHARGAAWGDATTRLLKASGYDCLREYYINDAGNQIHNLAESLISRYFELLGKSYPLPDDGYHGKDVIEIAKQIVEKDGDKWLNANEKERYTYFRKLGVEKELDKIKVDLKNFRVEFDVWSSEQAIRDAGKVEEVLTKLEEKGYTYEQEGALWFRTTEFGDDKDRVLRKTDGSLTYLVPDIAYHLNKLERGYPKLVDLLGADHHGYIPRLQASVMAFGYPRESVCVDIIQMVRLVENGVEVKMSKRTGNALTIRDLCDDIGVDAARYFFVARAVDTHFDFDLGLARSASADNPVFYAQYAHARICSILSQAPALVRKEEYTLLENEKEVALLKLINEFTNEVSDAAKLRAPNKICNYIQKLAQHFHSFYAHNKVNDKDNLELTNERVALLEATRITLRNALNLIGISAPEKM